MFRLLERWMILSVGLAAVACASAATDSPTATTVPPTSIAVTAAPSPTIVQPAPGSTATIAKTALSFQIASDGSSASYRVREQLASKSFPSDAVGTTKKVSGSLVVDPSGAVDPSKSKIVVDLTGLQSDSGRRDGFIQGGVLETRSFPTAEFLPTSIEGLPSPLPTSGNLQFKLAGTMTIHGKTKPMVWDVTAQVADKDVTGHATTSFTWADFGLSKPTVSVVLSVEDTVKLDVTLHLTPAA
jgi:polyisoprenoid-binding protein YceI